MTWPLPNRSGVFLPADCEVIELLAADAAPTKRQRRMLTPSAEILLVQAGPRRWFASAGYSLHSGDMRTVGSYPHDIDHDRFPDRDSALQAMAEYLLEGMGDVFRDSERERKRGLPPKGATYRIAQTELKEAERVARWAAGLIGEEAPEQLELFAASSE